MKKRPIRISHLTNRELDKVLNFLVSMNRLLSLPAYTFVIMEQPCSPLHDAEIEAVGNRWAAKVSLGVEWMDRDEFDRMKTLVHEVLHLTHRELNEVFYETQDNMHQHEFETLLKPWNRHLELMVDHWAQILSEVPAVREAWLNA